MTPKEFADRMREIAKYADDDTEAAHGNADDLMCQLLTTLGYHEGVQIFVEMPRWYA